MSKIKKYLLRAAVKIFNFKYNNRFDEDFAYMKPELKDILVGIPSGLIMQYLHSHSSVPSSIIGSSLVSGVMAMIPPFNKDIGTASVRALHTALFTSVLMRWGDDESMLAWSGAILSYSIAATMAIKLRNMYEVSVETSKKPVEPAIFVLAAISFGTEITIIHLANTAVKLALDSQVPISVDVAALQFVRRAVCEGVKTTVQLVSR